MGIAPDWYCAGRKGGGGGGGGGAAIPPNRVVKCLRANSERGQSLMASFRIQRSAPLIARLDWRGGLFLDSASALSEVVSDGEVESCLKRTCHHPNDHDG